MHSPTVGSSGGAVSYERGTPVRFIEMLPHKGVGCLGVRAGVSHLKHRVVLRVELNTQNRFQKTPGPASELT